MNQHYQQQIINQRKNHQNQNINHQNQNIKKENQEKIEKIKNVQNQNQN